MIPHSNKYRGTDLLPQYAEMHSVDEVVDEKADKRGLLSSVRHASVIMPAMYQAGRVQLAFILKTRDGKLDDEDTAQLTALTTALQLPSPQLLLHLHGGLVKEQNGVGIGTRLSGAVPDGFGLGQDWQQVFVVWRTGAFETVQANWMELFENDRLYKTLLRKLIEFAARKVILPAGPGRAPGANAGLTRAEIEARLRSRPGGDPFADIAELVAGDGSAQGRASIAPQQSEFDLVDEFENELTNDDEIADATQKLSIAVVPPAGRGGMIVTPDEEAVGARMLERLSGSVQGELNAKANGPGGRGLVSVAFAVIKHGGSIVLRVIRRMRSQRDHGFYATIVEELARELYGDLVGATIWGMMKRDAADHFADGKLGRQLIAAIPASCRIVVTAHSAGAIWVAEMMKAIAQHRPELKIDIVLLAPAVRMDLFADAIGRGGGGVGRRRVYTMSDELERADAVLGHDKGYIYPSSLLYLVSGVFEEMGTSAYPDAPLVGMQRFVKMTEAWLTPAEASANQTVIDFFVPPADAIVYAKTATTAAPGMRTQANTHGGFDAEHETLASVATFFV
jgi:hypothetical protein